MKIQSVASDMNLLSAIEAHETAKKNNLPVQIFALIHDSIVGLVRKDYSEEWGQVLQAITQKDRGCMIKGSPIGVSYGVGESYADTE